MKIWKKLRCTIFCRVFGQVGSGSVIAGRVVFWFFCCPPRFDEKGRKHSHLLGPHWLLVICLFFFSIAGSPRIFRLRLLGVTKWRFLHSATKSDWFYSHTIFECDVNFCGLRRVSTQKRKTKSEQQIPWVYSALPCMQWCNMSRTKRLQMSSHGRDQSSHPPKGFQFERKNLEMQNPFTKEEWEVEFIFLNSR